MLRQAARKIRHVLTLLVGLALLAGCDSGSSGGSREQSTAESPFCPASDAPVVNKVDPALASLYGIPAEQKQTLQTIRNAIFGGSLINAALQQTTISGEEPPVFPLELRDRSILVWRIDPAQVEAFSREIGLQNPLTLARAPLPGVADRSASSTEGHYYLLADIANTARGERGAKLEWKTFVSRDSDPTPRLYRFSKATSKAGLDLLEPRDVAASELQVSKSDEGVSVLLNGAADSLEVDIPLGNTAAAEPLLLSEEFLTAGEQTLGPNGLQSRYYYDGSSVSAPFSSIAVDQVRLTGNQPWLAYTENLAQVLVAGQVSEHLVQPANEAFEASPGAPCVAGPEGAGSAAELFSCLVGQALSGQSPPAVYAALYAAADNLGLSPSGLATLHYGIADLYQALAVYAGAERPKLFFALKPEPRAIFINFEIPEDRAEDFRQAFLPDSFELAQIRFYPEQCEPVYAVSLNVYEATGQNLDSFRAEWSTYVINPAEADPQPRFMVLEAQSTAGGLDPVIALERYRDWQQRNPGQAFNFLDPETLIQLIEEPNENFSYSLDRANGVRIQLSDGEEDISVDVAIAYPEPADILTTRPLVTWMEANDFVYWQEVADILKYDSKVMFAELLVFEAQPSDTIIDTTFEAYVKPEPLPIILWNGPQNIALEPWGNLDDIPVLAE
ncbi:hypothetical protein DWB85_10755 [Seongchinamella sediminis]|uniref:Uncharacterized protein n=1 Tax=Seongchinamella sediminis TaxID=2283635 RepID=A0A3L7DYZ1_9GAMM|nr:hypothetical protein [Seongchinamella sediminis]RLQ21760.1 hypothetical protein DWB85_10755 [Seongchinamella sediminis]